MGLKFSNYTMRKEEGFDSINRFQKCLKGFVVADDKDYPESQGEAKLCIDDDYYKINVVSFSQSFSKLQKNYRYDK